MQKGAMSLIKKAFDELGVKYSGVHYVRFDASEWAELHKAVDYDLTKENDAIDFVVKMHSQQPSVGFLVRTLMLGIVRGEFTVHKKNN